MLLFPPSSSFIHSRVFQGKRQEASRSFNFTFQYVDGILSLNNCKFGNFVFLHLYHWAWNKGYHTARYASYLDLHLEIDSEDLLKTKLYDKRDDLSSHLYVATFQQRLHIYLSADYISQRLCFLSCFRGRGLLLTRKLLNREFLVVKL